MKNKKLEDTAIIHITFFNNDGICSPEQAFSSRTAIDISGYGRYVQDKNYSWKNTTSEHRIARADMGELLCKWLTDGETDSHGDDKHNKAVFSLFAQDLDLSPIKTKIQLLGMSKKAKRNIIHSCFASIDINEYDKLIDILLNRFPYIKGDLIIAREAENDK